MSRNLFYYSDLCGCHGWFADAVEFRKRFPRSSYTMRCAHVGIAPPPHYRKGSGELANDPVERIPTVRDFIHGLTP
jgi:hypothetical protein